MDESAISLLAFSWISKLFWIIKMRWNYPNISIVLFFFFLDERIVGFVIQIAKAHPPPSFNQTDLTDQRLICGGYCCHSPTESDN